MEEENAHMEEELNQQVSSILACLICIVYLANTHSHASTGKTAGRGKGTLTADGRTEDQGVRRGDS